MGLFKKSSGNLSQIISINSLSTLSLILVAAVSQLGCSFSDLKPMSHPTPAEDLAVQLDQQVNLSDANWPTADWWKAFDDQQLNALVSKALTNSPSMKAAAAKIRQAQAIEGLQAAPLLPKVDGTLSSTRERFSANGTTPPPVAGTWQWLNQGSVNLSYEFDFWGKNQAALQAAIGRTHATEVEAQATRLTLASAITATYINLKLNNDELELETAALNNHLKVLDLTNKRFESQLDSQVNVKQVEASIPANRARIAELKENQELIKIKLATLTGEGPVGGLSIAPPKLKTPSTFGLPTQLTADLIGRRPDVVAQRWRVEATGYDIKEAKARFYPNVSLTSFIGLQSLGFDVFANGSSRILGVAPALSLPIFEGGRLRSNLALQNANYDQAVETYNQTILDAIKDISDQVTSLKWFAERVSQQRLGVETATEAASLAEQRYSEGLASYIDVLYAQDQEISQQRALAQLNARGLLLHAELSRALGGGYSPFIAPETKTK